MASPPVASPPVASLPVRRRPNLLVYGLVGNAVLLVVAVLLGVLGTAGAAGASASSDALEVSLDGVSYDDTLDAPLFDGDDTLVPGDTVVRSLTVRNAGPTSAVLAVSLRDARWTDADLASALTVRAARLTPPAAGDPVALTRGAECVTLLDGLALGAGQSLELSLEVAVGSLAGRDGQTADGGFALGLVLADAGSAPRACDDAAVVVPGAPSPTVPSPPTGKGSPEVVGESEAIVPPGAAPSLPETSGWLPIMANTSVNDLSLIVIALFAVLGGASISLVAAWRRRGSKEHA